MDIDPADRTAAPARRKPSSGIVPIAAGVAVLIAIAATALFWNRLGGGDRFTDLYAEWQTEPLPLRLQNLPEVLPLLVKLQREPCDDRAAASLGDTLAGLDERRAAAGILDGFTRKCPRFNRLMYESADFYFGVSDFAKAHEVAGRLVAQWPKIAQFHFLAAQIDQALGLNAEAITEFQASIDRTPDRRTLVEAVFTGLAKSYAQSGQFCRAADVLRQWVSLDPAHRDSDAVREMFHDYLVRGRCVE